MVKRFPVVNALAVILGMFVLGMAGTADALTYGTLPTAFNIPPGRPVSRATTSPTIKAGALK